MAVFGRNNDTTASSDVDLPVHIVSLPTVRGLINKVGKVFYQVNFAGIIL
jgi:hypothetical protein